MPRPVAHSVTVLSAMSGPVLLASLIASACGYDWALREATVRADAAADADPSSLADGAALVDAAPSPGDAGAADSQRDAHAGCQALALALAVARDAGQSCTQGATPPPCQSKLVDECGCNRYVGAAGSGEAKRYEVAIAEFKSSGCPKDCPAFCPPTAGACLLNPPHCNP